MVRNEQRAQSQDPERQLVSPQLARVAALTEKSDFRSYRRGPESPTSPAGFFSGQFSPATISPPGKASPERSYLAKQVKLHLKQLSKQVNEEKKRRQVMEREIDELTKQMAARQ